ncbi:unnamed protein product, partial [Vitis vinifera]|uniref:Uncharacterized protein n=1 Tax=Vitis vinifera TaxID=29760 RepID=D7U5T8_VITVI
MVEGAWKLLELSPHNFHGDLGHNWAIPFSWKNHLLKSKSYLTTYWFTGCDLREFALISSSTL